MTITATHWAVEQNGYAIFGYGETKAEAIAMAQPYLEDGDEIAEGNCPIGDMRLMPATAALEDADWSGGYDQRDGILCTIAEAKDFDTANA